MVFSSIKATVFYPALAEVTFFSYYTTFPWCFFAKTADNDHIEEDKRQRWWRHNTERHHWNKLKSYVEKNYLSAYLQDFTRYPRDRCLLGERCDVAILDKIFIDPSHLQAGSYHNFHYCSASFQSFCFIKIHIWTQLKSWFVKLRQADD